MTRDGVAVAQAGDGPGALAADGQGSEVDRPAVDESVIEQLAGITDSQGYSVLGELLNAFLGAVPGRLQALDRAVAAGDAAAVGDQAHALTGSTASFGARGMADLCRELRVVAEHGDIETARRLVRALHTEFLCVRGWLMDFRSRA